MKTFKYDTFSPKNYCPCTLRRGEFIRDTLCETHDTKAIAQQTQGLRS